MQSIPKVERVPTQLILIQSVSVYYSYPYLQSWIYILEEVLVSVLFSFSQDWHPQTRRGSNFVGRVRLTMMIGQGQSLKLS